MVVVRHAVAGQACLHIVHRLAAGDLARGFLHPTINLTDPDPDCDLDFIPNEGRAAQPEAALCNCLGFGSKNSALVLGRSDG